MGHCSGCAFGAFCGGNLPLKEALMGAMLELNMDLDTYFEDMYSIICRFGGVDPDTQVDLVNHTEGEPVMPSDENFAHIPDMLTREAEELETC